MKTCTKCKKEKCLDSFSWKNKAKGRKSSECKECHRKQRQKHYQNNKKSEIARVKLRREDIRDYINDVKSNSRCPCGEDHIATLQFHHIDSETKRFEISKAPSLGISKKVLDEEIQKCIILCSNCHAKLHWEENHADIV